MAETTYTPFQGEPEAAPVRLIVRRVKPTPGSQLALFASYSYHGFITDRDGETLELEADHRRHAEIENAIRDLKHGVGLNHRPDLLAAQLRLADVQPEACRCDRGVGGCLGLNFEGVPQVPGDRQLPRLDEWLVVDPLHPRLTAAASWSTPSAGRLHLRPGAGAPSPGIKPQRWSVECPTCGSAFFKGGELQGSVGHCLSDGQAMVPDRWPDRGLHGNRPAESAPGPSSGRRSRHALGCCGTTEPYEMTDWRTDQGASATTTYACQYALYSVPIYRTCPPGQKVDRRGSAASWCASTTGFQTDQGPLRASGFAA